MIKITAIKDTLVATNDQCVTFHKGDRLFVKNIRSTFLEACTAADMLMTGTCGIVSVDVILITNDWEEA